MSLLRYKDKKPLMKVLTSVEMPFSIEHVVQTFFLSHWRTSTGFLDCDVIISSKHQI